MVFEITEALALGLQKLSASKNNCGHFKLSEKSYYGRIKD